MVKIILYVFVFSVFFNCGISRNSLKNDKPDFYKFITESKWSILESDKSTKVMGELKFTESGQVEVALVGECCYNKSFMNEHFFQDNYLFQDTSLFQKWYGLEWEPISSDNEEISSEGFRIEKTIRSSNSSGSYTDYKHIVIIVDNSYKNSNPIIKKAFLINGYNTEIIFQELRENKNKDGLKRIFFINSELDKVSLNESDKEIYKTYYDDLKILDNLKPDLTNYTIQPEDTKLKMDEKVRNTESYLSKNSNRIINSVVRFNHLQLSDIVEERELTAKGKKYNEDLRWYSLKILSGNATYDDRTKFENIAKLVEKEYTGKTIYKALYLISKENPKASENSFRTIITRHISKNEAMKLEKNKEYSLSGKIKEIEYSTLDGSHIKDNENLFVFKLVID